MSGGNQEVWERIQRFYNATKRPVFVCVGYTADAAAACQIVTALLKNNLVPFSVQPMMTMGEVSAVVQRSQLDDTDDALFFLIGIGATSSLRDVFDSTRHVVILLDNHRPVHLNNLRDEGALGGPDASEPWLCLWQRDAVTSEVDRFFLTETRRRVKKRKRFNQRAVARRELRQRRRETERAEGTADRNLRASKTTAPKHRKTATGGGAPHAGGDAGDALDDPEDVYEEEGEEDGGDAGTASLDSSDEEAEEEEVTSSDDDDGGDDDDSIEDEDAYEVAGEEDDDVVPTSQQVDWRASATDDGLPADIRDLYYSTECCGTSVAQEALDVSLRLGRSRDVFLWFAAIGVTDLFLRSATDYSSYLLSMTKIRDHIALLTSARLRATTAAQQSTNDGFGTKLSLADEPQLLLLRHWTLWASVWHGKWTAGLLRLHHVDRGEETLKELFARCGISSRVAQQSWTEASADTRSAAVDLVCQELANLELLKGGMDGPNGGGGAAVDDLDDRLSDNSGGPSVPYNSFRRAHHHPTIPCVKHPNVVPTVTRSTGFGTGVSALDVCHMFRGVLCAPLQLTTHNSGSLDALQAALADHHRDVFWRAHDVLDLDPNTPAFADALDDAKRLQSSVVTATSALMQRGVILSTRALHHTIMSDPSRRSGMMDSFWTPLRLQYLAEHVAVALTIERGRRWEMRPLALCCAWPLRDASHGGPGGAAHLQIALVHSGAVNGPNRPLSVVAAWNGVVAAQRAEDASSVDADPLLPLTCRVRGRDTASHLMESLYLRCAENTRTMPLSKEQL